MVNFLMIIPITVILTIVGFGVGYWFFIATRPKKMTWKARVYQLGEGVIPPLKDEKGKVVSEIKLRDLRPYTLDTLERVEKGKNLTLYRLLKLNRTTPQVTGDCIEYWGKDGREVSVLMESESCTILKKGYDISGSKVFRPLPYDKINMVKNEMAIRQDRLHKEKDILMALAPYATVAIAMTMLVAIVFLQVKGITAISEMQSGVADRSNEAMIKASENYASGLATYGNIPSKVPLTPQPTEPPPAINPD